MTGSVSTYRQVARVLLLFRHISDDVSPLSIDDLVVPHFSLVQLEEGTVRGGVAGPTGVTLRQSEAPEPCKRVFRSLQGESAGHT